MNMKVHPPARVGWWSGFCLASPNNSWHVVGISMTGRIFVELVGGLLHAPSLGFLNLLKTQLLVLRRRLIFLEDGGLDTVAFALARDPTSCILLDPKYCLHRLNKQALSKELIDFFLYN